MRKDSKHTEPRLAEAFDYADSVRERVKAAKQHTQEHPSATARRASEGFGTLKRQLRARAAELHGVDVANPEEALKMFKVRDYLKTWDFLRGLNMYSVYEDFQRSLQQLASDATLPEKELAAKVRDVLRL